MGRKMDAAEAIRTYHENPGLDEGLRGAHALLKAGEREDAFGLLDLVYLNHIDTFPDRVKEVSPEFHADITERVEFQDIEDSFLIIKKGTTVTWVNQEDTAHTVSGTIFDSGTILKGITFSHTFDTEGTFDYICNIHPSMTGSVVVQ